jgi:hypothetical protein
MRYLKWAVIGLGAVVAFMVSKKLLMRQSVRAGSKTPLNGQAADANGRVPGMIDNLKDSISGFFGKGNKPDSVPPITGGYGAVGVQGVGVSTYQAVPTDSRIPTFLDGSSGGVVDDARPGDAPPPVAGVTGLPGSATATSPYYSMRQIAIVNSAGKTMRPADYN